jgi:maltose-binding protein MalE
MVKTIAFILLICMLLSCISCQNTPVSNIPTDTAALTDAEESPDLSLRENTPDTLPDGLDFEGAVLNISTRGDTDSVLDFFSEQTGDIVEDAIYRRNIRVEERLNIRLNVIPGEKWETYNTTVNVLRSSIQAGDGAFDIISGWSARIPQLAVEGCLKNLYEMPYINFEQPWWVRSLVEELTIADKLYLATGDIVLSLLSPAYVIYFNKTLEQKYNVNNMYDTVLDGKWTIDSMTLLSKDIYEDLNGDGKMNEQDLFASVWTATNNVDCFLQGSNIKMIEKDSEGYPVLAYEYDKINTIVEKVYSFMYENPGVLSYTVEGGTNTENQINMFKADRALFIPSPLSVAAGSFKDMTSDYGIIPYPKFDEAQEQYLTRIQDAVALVCVPITLFDEKTEAVGAALEALAAESYRNVTAVYFEVAMKVKYSRDDISSQMLDIVRGGAYLNFASIYNESIGNPWFVMRTLMGAKKKDFASWYATNEPVIQKKLAEVTESIRAIS